MVERNTCVLLGGDEGGLDSLMFLLINFVDLVLVILGFVKVLGNGFGQKIIVNHLGLFVSLLAIDNHIIIYQFLLFIKAFRNQSIDIRNSLGG
jgi:hypothetical protein